MAKLSEASFPINRRFIRPLGHGSAAVNQTSYKHFGMRLDKSGNTESGASIDEKFGSFKINDGTQASTKSFLMFRFGFSKRDNQIAASIRLVINLQIAENIRTCNAIIAENLAICVRGAAVANRNAAHGTGQSESANLSNEHVNTVYRGGYNNRRSLYRRPYRGNHKFRSFASRNTTSADDTQAHALAVLEADDEVHAPTDDELKRLILISMRL